MLWLLPLQSDRLCFRFPQGVALGYEFLGFGFPFGRRPLRRSARLRLYMLNSLTIEWRPERARLVHSADHRIGWWSICALKGQGLHIAQGIALWYYAQCDFIRPVRAKALFHIGLLPFWASFVIMRISKFVIKNLSSVNLSNCQGGVFYFTVTFLPFLMINPLALPLMR